MKIEVWQDIYNTYTNDTYKDVYMVVWMSKNGNYWCINLNLFGDNKIPVARFSLEY